MSCFFLNKIRWETPSLTCHRWEKLKLVRVYTKPKGKMPDYTSPVVLRSTKCTVEDFVSGKPSCSTPQQATNSDVVQRHPSDYCRTVQGCHRVRQVSQAPAAARWSVP